MPSEKIERSSNLMLKQFKTMEVDIPQNHSQAELLHSNSQSDRRDNVEVKEKTLRDVTSREWIAIFILCFVNLINYMDRFTIAGDLESINELINCDNPMSNFGIVNDSSRIRYLGINRKYKY
ncbi:hypothetical protein HHI36_015169 [Cryptolaemus montrouzieri]|uniref:Uncharacterized protein n=1 Tax=Cryptolaemus montrouzieri TaxID=559131 RepID=A0ABD2N4S9_9CUCU